MTLAGAPGRVAIARPGALRVGGLLAYLYFLWFIVLADPQWWIASFGASLVLKVPTVLFALLLLLTIAKGPRHLLPPLLAFMLYMVLSIPFAYIRGLAFEVTKIVFAYYVIALATLTIVRDARATVPIVLWALLGQFAWWVAIGAKNGLVSWDFALANYDSFGPLMVIGMATCYYAGMAMRSRKARVLAFLLAGGCLLGLVSSYARGAVVSGAVVAVWIWARSKHKAQTALFGVAAAVVLFVSTTVFFANADRGPDSNPNFWTEMGTITSEAGSTTRNDREVLWAVARAEFLQHPLFGVGPRCFGPYAAGTFGVGKVVGGDYADNPQRLWGRELHNTYYQILSEFGAVGCAIFLWILWDFFKRNRALRKPERLRAWAMGSGGRFDLWYLSLGLEAGMLAYLATGYFYNQIFDVNWFYTLLTINALLFQVTQPARASAAPRPAT